MTKLLRFHAAFSLLAVVATAALLTWYDRRVATEAMVVVAEGDNIELAQFALDSMKPSLVEYLAEGSATQPPSPRAAPPAKLVDAIAGVLQEQEILSVTVYDRAGTVAYSTRPDWVGRARGDDPRVRSALAGIAGSEVVRRGAAENLDATPRADNVMRARVPIRAAPAAPVLGAFELHVDVGPLLRQTERTAWRVFWGALALMALLSAALFVIMGHAHRKMEQRERSIRQRQQVLASWAGQMLKSEEMRRRQVATDLHEGVAQLLAAAKLEAEARLRDPAADRSSGEAMIPLLREAIDEVRSIASGLRPPGLDDLGLLRTLRSLCRDLERRHPPLQVDCRLEAGEDDVRESLKGIIYRICASVLDAMAREGGHARLRLALLLQDDELVLRIGGKPGPAGDAMEQLVVLSGGAFSQETDVGEGTSLVAGWSTEATRPGTLAELRM